MATRATRPTVRPTAPPVLSPPPPPLLFLTSVRLDALGGTVGVTVTVFSWPVTVSSDMTGVAVHVEDEDDVVDVEDDVVDDVVDVVEVV